MPAIPATKKSIDVGEIIAAHNSILSLVHSISNSITMIDNWADSFLGMDYLSMLLRRESFNPEACTNIVRSRFWSRLIKNSPLFLSMTESAKNSLLEKIDQDPPEFSQHEISIFVNNVERLYSQNAIQTIKEVYRTLIGCTYYGSSWNNRKQDNLQRVNPTFRISGNIAYCKFTRRFKYQFPYRSYFCFDDFLTACYLLDGKSKPASGDSFASLAESAFCAGLSSVKTPYFTVYCYKNQNQKIVFSKEKHYVLDFLNRFGSNNELPDTMKKRYKREHFSTAEATA